MNCANHPEVPAIAFCRECGKPICQACERLALGSVYCQEHLPAAGPHVPPPVPPEMPLPSASFTGSPYAAPSNPHYAHAPGPVYSVPEPHVHPILALILGFFPGVGAIYNGQYAKGLVHAVTFGLLVSIASHSHNSYTPLVGISIGIWVIYQAFEAYHTARKRRYGMAVEEFSSLFEVRTHHRFPFGAIILIGLGFVLLLDTTDIISMEQFERYWPALLIVLGLYMLYARLNPGPNHIDGNIHGDMEREVRQ